MSNSNVKVKSKKFVYKTSIKMHGKGEGTIESAGKPSMELSTPVEFGGKGGVWTPEDLLVASVNACLMTTFSYYVVKKGLKIVSYESSAEGTVELVEMQYIFSEIILRPEVVVKSAEDIEMAKSLLEISKKNCFISNSLKSKVILEPEIKSIS